MSGNEFDIFSLMTLLDEDGRAVIANAIANARRDAGPNWREHFFDRFPWMREVVELTELDQETAYNRVLERAGAMSWAVKLNRELVLSIHPWLRGLIDTPRRNPLMQ